MEDLLNPEEKILCPYNSSHHIRRCKMSFHLVKCKKNYGEQKMIPCDFNATHMIPEPEIRYHQQTCPDRKKIEARIVDFQKKTDKFPIPKIDVPTDENWDDYNVPTYDPVKYTENNDVLRHLDVESGAKRKNFRMNERLRHGELSRQKNAAPVTEPQKDIVELPPHRAPTHIRDDKFNPHQFKEKLKLETNKVFLQNKSNN